MQVRDFTSDGQDMTVPETLPASSGDESAIRALIAHCQTGDQAAYGALYQAVTPGLYRLAYSILLDRQDAEDVTQEAMVYAFRNLHRYDPARGTLRTWLYTITVSRCRNARRRKWLPTTALANLLHLEPTIPESHTPEAAVARRSVREALEKALATLSPRLREAIALRYGQGLTYREMAEILDCPQKTAESRIRLAHEALRAAMQAEDVALLEELWSF
ncbi:MAG TPA: RNA polymerase sigma factor [Aggregatilineales bacterium]|nr:RNA polymerase sigma factor [Aggregatilineales bacterium]